VNDKGDQVEAQYIYQGERYNLVVGAAQSESDRRYDTNFLFTHSLFGDLVVDQSTSTEKIKQPRAYVYANINTTPSVTWTVGASGDNYQQGTLEEKSINPKLGVQWNVTNNVRLRAAGFKVVKPVLVNNRTLEPTQVAGFNQFFDDINGTKSERYAGGLDWQLNRDLAAGFELTERKLEEPTYDVFASTWMYEGRQEQNHKLYLYWTPAARLVVRTELVFDLFESNTGIATEFDNLPTKVTTVSLPLGVTYFSPSGVFAGVTGTYVDQTVERSASATQASGSDNFFIVDAALGYRFDKRRGMVSLGVKNLFDTKFNYQDDSYREFRDEPSIGPYFPVRTIMGRISLNF